jgi:hypothetical protein
MRAAVRMAIAVGFATAPSLSAGSARAVLSIQGPSPLRGLCGREAAPIRPKPSSPMGAQPKALGVVALDAVVEGTSSS